MSSLNSNNLKFVALWVAIPYLLGCWFSDSILPETIVQNVITPAISTFSGSSHRGEENDSTTNTITNNNNDDNNNNNNNNNNNDLVSNTYLSNHCKQNLWKILGLKSGQENPFQNVTIMMHRNGQPTSCGTAESQGGFLEELEDNYAFMFDANANDKNCPSMLNKYQVESLLTRTFQSIVRTCNTVENDGNHKAGFLGFCDMGPKRTPILLDHQDLVPVEVMENNRETTFLPCRFHTREGLRITQMSQLVEMTMAAQTSTTMKEEACKPGSVTEGEDQSCSATTGDADQGEDSSTTGTVQQPNNEIHLYAVPAGRVFMFAPSYVGEIFHLPHVEGSDNKLIYLKVLSLNPRVFDVFNFFSRDESTELVERAIAETSDSHRIKRSSTGATGYNVNSRRTSESGFDTHGKTAVKVKKRCFKTLGFDEYWESHGDGLQILRYNISKAYNSHLDYIEDTGGQLEHDFDSSGTGGNRFATILMYMSDLGPEDGGETVFPHGWPPNLPVEDRVDTKQALEQLRASDRGGVLEQGSWEEELVGRCRTRLAIQPHSSRAVLFYSQFPNGKVDPASLHGACPVLNGQKYAANLWVWNTPRQGYPNAPIKEKFRKQSEDVSNSPSISFRELKVTFSNTGSNPEMANAKLFFEDQFWGNLGHKDPSLGVNTYQGHVWNVRVDDKVVKTWTIAEKDGNVQSFSI